MQFNGNRFSPALSSRKSAVAPFLPGFNAAVVSREWDGQIGDAQARTIKKLGAEIHLLVAKAERAPMPGSNSGGNIFNVSGSVGTIQTGLGSLTIFRR